MKQTLKNNNLFTLFMLLSIFSLQCRKASDPPPPPPDPPSISAVDPADGIIGDPVTIKGSNLGDIDKIMFGTITATKIDGTNSSITTVVPPGTPTGALKVSVHSPAGTSNQADFKVLEEPEHVDTLPPTLSKAIPSTGYTEYPVLIYGENLSGVIKITFNDKDAVIYTNNTNVITTTIPKDIPAGPATIKVRTIRGTTTINFQVQGVPPTPATVNFGIVTIPPPNYVPGISNQWSCALLSRTSGDEQSGGEFVGLGSDNNGDQNYNITGRFEYSFDKVNDYNTKNYVEIIYHAQKDTLVGQFSSKFNNPCILTMVLISSKTGEISTCTFNRRDNDDTLECEK